ncbi:flagellar basal body-associated FliL family protein [Brassicibacter mesophilus]|jgi:flagellar protein FliL|uniref:flagellar basal body-associated FliL family protein n=1 Tax=Brassicibacter mesophilus TaxID=745119 RepID=UPI003D2446CB
MSTKKIFMIAILSFIVVGLIIGTVFGIMLLKQNEQKVAEKQLYYYNIGEMYCNLKNSNRIVKINTTVEMNNEELIVSLEEKSFLIKDEINKIIRNKTEQDIEGSEGQLSLQKEITEKLIELFGNTEISNVYFDEFIVQ